MWKPGRLFEFSTVGTAGPLNCEMNHPAASYWVCKNFNREKYVVFYPVASYREYWGILVLFNVVFFVAAFAGFMRYDVR